MDRRKTIKHSDNLFAPKEETGIPSEIAMLAPMVGFLLGCYIWMFFDMGII